MSDDSLQSDLAELELVFGSLSFEEATEKIQKEWSEYENITLDIAITGESGAGKSTFINALHGLSQDDEDAAETGVTGTTTKPKAYKHPQDQTVTYWDLPGLGTPAIKSQQYYDKVHFEKYDFFIIIASERFRESHIDLAKRTQAMKKRFYIVRSKIDQDLSNAKRSKPSAYNEETILQTIRNDCVQKLKDGCAGNPLVFLISSFDFNLYDFNVMIETMKQEMPSHKRHKFILSLPNASLQIIEEKRHALRGQIWKKALLSSIVSFVPIPGLSFACDIPRFVNTLNEYVKCLCLDEQTLTKLSDVCEKDIKSVIQSQVCKEEINESFVIKLLVHKEAEGERVGKRVLQAIPIFGSVYRSAMAFITLRDVLYKALDEAADDTKRVCEKILN
uniref:IRG-type G domain-containing protein n=1 Tax=Leptobrachium leishanense TaxID=445787 RepID=A0A8C5PS38_9ANUR